MQLNHTKSEFAAFGAAASGPAATAHCRPEVTPYGVKIGGEETELEFEIDATRCQEGLRWFVKAGSNWFALVNENDVKLTGFVSSGKSTIKVKVDAASPRKFGGTRSGTFYIQEYIGKPARTLSTFKFTQSIPKP